MALDKLPLKAMQEVEPRITKAVFGVLSVGNSVKSRAAYGGTAPRNVRAQAKRWLKASKKLHKSRSAKALTRLPTQCRRAAALC